MNFAPLILNGQLRDRKTRVCDGRAEGGYFMSLLVMNPNACKPQHLYKTQKYENQNDIHRGSTRN
jgi:hypothetical protein